MSHWAFYDRTPVLTPFRHHGRDGQLAIYYAPDDDPVQSGFDLIPGLPFPPSACLGYPVIHAMIESYQGSGYSTLAGWIQVLTDDYYDDPASFGTPTTTEFFIDMPPSLQEINQPFYAFGNAPQLFDAPARNLGSYAKLRWTADTFLTTLPGRSRDEAIARLAGFRWGYVETNIPGDSPVLLPLEITGPEAWNRHLPFLREHYSMWKFVSA